MMVTKEANNEIMGMNVASIICDKNKVFKSRKNLKNASSCVLMKIEIWM